MWFAINHPTVRHYLSSTFHCISTAFPSLLPAFSLPLGDWADRCERYRDGKRPTVSHESCIGLLSYLGSCRPMTDRGSSRRGMSTSGTASTFSRGRCHTCGRASGRRRTSTTTTATPAGARLSLHSACTATRGHSSAFGTSPGCIGICTGHDSHCRHRRSAAPPHLSGRFSRDAEGVSPF